jgi:hypothetical protein
MLTTIYVDWSPYECGTRQQLPAAHQLALGRTYEAAGQRDSAAVAYGRFLRFWDKADPEMQGKVREAREALLELSRERPNAR